MNDFPSPSQEKFLSRRQRSQPIVLPEEFSDEEMARDWTLSAPDRATLLECIQNAIVPGVAFSCVRPGYTVVS